MAKYTGSCGTSGCNLTEGTYSIGISLPSGEYPTKVTFATKSDGAYWTNVNKSYDVSGTIYLCDKSGKNAVKLGTIKLGKGKDKTSTPTYSVNAKNLAGKKLAIKIEYTLRSGFRLKNNCQITVETKKDSSTSKKATSPDIYKKLLPTVSQSDKKIGYARQSTWKVAVKGVDITKEIKKDLISMEITDNEENEADDFQIKLSDRDGVWLQKWLNESVQKGAKTKGLTFTVWIGTQTHAGKISQLKPGSYYLDTMKHKGPPAVVTIKCTSCDFSGGIRSDENDKSWENYNLKGIAEDIASKGKLKLLYCTKKNPKYTRKEQSEETDIAFLIRVCQESGLSVKITDEKLVVFDRKDLEKRGVISTITYGDGKYLSWDLSTTSGDVTYDICTVKYTDPKTGKCITGCYKTDEWQEEEDRVAEENEDKDDDDELEVASHLELIIKNKKVKSIKEANELAEVELNLRNKFERSVTLTVPGNPAIIAGLPIALKKFGYWSGKYMINQVVHSISTSGYTTKMKLRRIINDESKKTGDTDDTDNTDNSNTTETTEETETKKTTYSARVYYTLGSGSGGSVVGYSTVSYKDALSKAYKKVPTNAVSAGTTKPEEDT